MEKRREDTIVIDNIDVVSVPDVDNLEEANQKRIRILADTVNELFRERKICSHRVRSTSLKEEIVWLKADIDRDWSDHEWDVLVNELDKVLKARFPKTDIHAHRDPF
ncbi:MAG TPA: hypothetical protein DD435_07905 [Cyanobacteria bacterium UBA8530]|nr:hypothetical protein [Cyanobacteria bacterium UBA8530]